MTSTDRFKVIQVTEFKAKCGSVLNVPILSIEHDFFYDAPAQHNAAALVVNDWETRKFEFRAFWVALDPAIGIYRLPGEDIGFCEIGGRLQPSPVYEHLPVGFIKYHAVPQDPPEIRRYSGQLLPIFSIEQEELTEVFGRFSALPIPIDPSAFRELNRRALQWFGVPLDTEFPLHGSLMGVYLNIKPVPSTPKPKFMNDHATSGFP